MMFFTNTKKQNNYSKIKIFIIFIFVILIICPIKSTLSFEQSTSASTQGDFEHSVDTYRLNKKRFQETRTKFEKTKDAALQPELINQEKSYYIALNNVIINYLNLVREEINNITIQDFDTKTSLTTIDGYISGFNQNEKNLQSSNNEQEIINNAKTIKKQWSLVRMNTRKIVSQIYYSKLSTIEQELSDQSSKIASQIDSLKKSNKDTTRLETVSNQTTISINKAKDKIDSANQKIISFSTQNNQAAFQSIIELFTQSATSLNDALKNYLEAQKILARLTSEE